MKLFFSFVIAASLFVSSLGVSQYYAFPYSDPYAGPYGWSGYSYGLMYNYTQPVLRTVTRFRTEAMAVPVKKSGCPAKVTPRPMPIEKSGCPAKTDMPMMPKQPMDDMDDDMDDINDDEPMTPMSDDLENQHDKLVVMFTKSACPYCDYLKPIMDDVKESLADSDVKVMFVDINENPDVVSKYGFNTVPTVVYFKDGKEVDRHGSSNKTETAESVNERIEEAFDL